MSLSIGPLISREIGWDHANHKLLILLSNTDYVLQSLSFVSNPGDSSERNNEPYTFCLRRLDGDPAIVTFAPPL
jgi:hypothetical protein